MAGKGATLALPLLAFCCLGMILLGIAITVVLALIPLYTTTTPVTVASTHATSKSFTQTSSIDGSIPTATSLSDASKAKIVAAAKQAMSNSDKSSVDIAAKSAAISEPTSKRRHAGGKHTLTVEYTIFGRNQALIALFIIKLRAFIAANPDLFSNALEDLITANSTTTTVTAGAVSASVTTTTTTAVSATASASATAAVSANPTGAGRRRRNNEDATTASPLVTYKD